MDKEHYLGLFSTNRINKLLIYSLTHSINDTLHFDFLIKNLYHRMILLLALWWPNVMGQRWSGVCH